MTNEHYHQALRQAEYIADVALLRDNHPVRLAVRSGNIEAVSDALEASRPRLGGLSFMVGEWQGKARECGLIAEVQVAPKAAA